MTILETNLTFGQQYCSMVTGAFIGIGAFAIYLSRLLVIALGFYIVYRVTKIWMVRKRK